MSNNAHVNLAQVAQKFEYLQSRLYAQFPGCRVEAERLAAEVVDCETADAETIWSVLWDKPLYTNRETSEGKRYAGALSAEMPGSWQQMTGKLSPYHIKRKDRADWADKMGKTNGSFEVLGRVVERWQDEFGLAYQFAYPIVNAGIALNQRSKKSQTPFKDISIVPLGTLVPRLKKEFGWAWGHTTVLHFLTDLGLGMKPDRHLMRSTRYIGLHDIKSDDPDEKEAIVVNGLVRDLCRHQFGNDAAGSLRTMDKNLMDISVKGLLTAPS